MSKLVVACAAMLSLAGYTFVYASGRADWPIRSDGFSYYVYLPSWFIFHDPSLAATARDCCGGEFPSFTAIIRWPGTRRWVNAHPIGVAVMHVRGRPALIGPEPVRGDRDLILRGEQDHERRTRRERTHLGECGIPVGVDQLRVDLRGASEERAPRRGEPAAGPAPPARPAVPRPSDPVRRAILLTPIVAVVVGIVVV